MSEYWCFRTACRDSRLHAHTLIFQSVNILTALLSARSMAVHMLWDIKYKSWMIKMTIFFRQTDNKEKIPSPIHSRGKKLSCAHICFKFTNKRCYDTRTRLFFLLFPALTCRGKKLRRAKCYIYGMPHSVLFKLNEWEREAKKQQYIFRSNQW